MLAGPSAYQLAVLGAETIKIEEPGQGDIARQTGSDRAQNRRLMGTGYLTQGSNKRCVTLDLKDPRGRDILKRLVVGADVLVENFRAGAMGALGLGYEDLRRINPRLIYCSMTGFGQDGPKAEHNAYDCVIQAISGLMSTTGWPGGPPVKTGAPVIDYASGLSGAFAVSSALFQRERTGRGQYIDCAMLDAAMMLMSSHLTACSWSGVAPKPRGNDLEYAGEPTRPGDGSRARSAASTKRPGTRSGALISRRAARSPTRRSIGSSSLPRCDHAHADRGGVGGVPGRDPRRAPACGTSPRRSSLKQVAQRNLLHRFEHVPEVDRPPRCRSPVSGSPRVTAWTRRPAPSAPTPTRAGGARAQPGGDCLPAPGPRRLISGRRTPDGRIRVGSTPEGASDLAGTTLRPVRSWR